MNRPGIETRRKVLTLVGTRPEIIKLSCVIPELDRQTDHILVHSGQNYDFELSEVFFRDLGIRQPDRFLNAAADTPAQTIANVIASSDRVFEECKPEALLLYGDTNSCLAVIAAKRRKIPVFHMEAGNRCFDDRVPEEINRRLVDHLSDVNMPLTEHARRYLLAEGIRAETVFKIGSPMREVLARHMSGIRASDALTRNALTAQGYILVSAHREENVDSPPNLESFVETLDALAEVFDRDVLVSTHPRTRRRLAECRRGPASPRVRLVSAMGFLDYVRLQLDAYCVVSDSGTLTEEGAILDLPVVMIREAHERPEGMDQGVSIMSGLVPSRVVDAVRVVTSQRRDGRARGALVPDYAPDDVSRKVVRIILSYIDYVNRTVWHR